MVWVKYQPNLLRIPNWITVVQTPIMRHQHQCFCRIIWLILTEPAWTVLITVLEWHKAFRIWSRRIILRQLIIFSNRKKKEGVLRHLACKIWCKWSSSSNLMETNSWGVETRFRFPIQAWMWLTLTKEKMADTIRPYTRRRRSLSPSKPHQRHPTDTRSKKALVNCQSTATQSTTTCNSGQLQRLPTTPIWPICKTNASQSTSLKATIVMLAPANNRNTSRNTSIQKRSPKWTLAPSSEHHLPVRVIITRGAVRDHAN